MRIELTTTKYKKKPNTKTVWIEDSKTTKKITKKQYNNGTSQGTIKFFRNLGGIETVTKSYTRYGYIIVQIDSTSPNRENKTVRYYEFI